MSQHHKRTLWNRFVIWLILLFLGMIFYYCSDVGFHYGNDKNSITATIFAWLSFIMLLSCFYLTSDIKYSIPKCCAGIMFIIAIILAISATINIIKEYTSLGYYNLRIAIFSILNVCLIVFSCKHNIELVSKQ